MKRIKKLVAIALVGAMALVMAVPGFAATSGSDTGSITVSNLEDGVTVSAYQIAYATYDGSGNFTGYVMVSGTEGCAFQIGTGGDYDESALTEANLKELYEKVKGNQAAGSAQAAAAGTATIANLPVGSYLLVVTGAESTVYSLMIGSVYYTTEDGDWTVQSGEIDATAGTNTWAKSTEPTIDKEEVGADDKDTHGDSASVGDEITFHITLDNLPHYEGDYPKYDVDDQLTGLSISSDELNSLTVTVVDSNGDTVVTLVKDTDYTLTTVGDPNNDGTYGEFDVNFVVNGKYTLNDYADAGYSIRITYQATVTDAAVVDGVVDHDNHAILSFSTNSLIDDEDGVTTTDDSHEYSFSASFTKVGSDDAHSTALSGATFTLYDTVSAVVATATSDGSGTFTFSDLKEGTYTMKETEAPTGYALNTDEYTVVVDASYNADGTLNTWTITVSGGSLGSAVTVTGTPTTGVTIMNVSLSGGGLPNTGGRGTLIFTLIGCAIVVGAVAGVVATRKRRAA